MRHLILAAVFVTACTASVTVNKTPMTQRVADACADLDALCTSTGTCAPRDTLCKPAFGSLYAAEDTCKSGCNDVRTCIKACKATRVNAMGDISSTCTTVATACSTTGDGCTGAEFFCSSFALSSSPCQTALAACKAACAPHDRTCLKQCRDAYRQCLAGSTPDAGVPDAAMPDAPPPPPDAAMPDAAAPDAPVTTTNYTYTTDIAPKMTGLCNGCHSGSSPPGNYLTTSYAALFGNGSDNTPNIIAGDANSLFVQKIAGNHHNVLALYPGFDTVARDWVVNNHAQQ